MSFEQLGDRQCIVGGGITGYFDFEISEDVLDHGCLSFVGRRSVMIDVLSGPMSHGPPHAFQKGEIQKRFLDDCYTRRGCAFAQRRIWMAGDENGGRGEV